MEKSEVPRTNKEQLKKNKIKTKQKSEIKWAFSMLIVSFVISVILSYGSSVTLSRVDYITSIIILAVFIAIGIIFDIVGLAVASCDEKPFHSMSAKKVKGARACVWLAHNADRVSSFCNDVVGDIAGIISGSTGAAITAGFVADYGVNAVVFSLVITGIISSFTIFGKAIGKKAAINYSEKIVFLVGRIIELFGFPSK